MYVIPLWYSLLSACKKRRPGPGWWGLRRRVDTSTAFPGLADVAARDVNADDFDAVVVPGGFAPDRLRRYEEVLALVRGVFAKGGVVAAICHAGWVPISAGILRGKRATCVAAIKDDMTTRGALLRLPVVVMATW